MPSSREPQPERDDGYGARDRVPAGPSRGDSFARVQIRTGAFIARHPRLLKVLEALGWNNPGGNLNP
jgi:hypothetical protein